MKKELRLSKEKQFKETIERQLKTPSNYAPTKDIDKTMTMCENFLDSIEGKPGTRRTFQSLFRRHIPRSLVPVTDRGLSELISQWRKKGLSPRTILSLLILTRRWAKFNGYDVDISGHYKRVQRSYQETPLRVLDKIEMKKLTEACKEFDPEFYPVLLCALHTGMRRGEVFGLRGDDVDLIRGYVIIQRSYDGPTKNNKIRKVQLTKDLQITLGDLIFDKGDKPIFPDRYDPNPRLKAICRHAGLPEIRFHDVRHSFASAALEAGKSPKLVQRALGHTSVTTTLNIYWQAIGDVLETDFLEEK